jgi:hypothetical protein
VWADNIKIGLVEKNGRMGVGLKWLRTGNGMLL